MGKQVTDDPVITDGEGDAALDALRAELARIAVERSKLDDEYARLRLRENRVNRSIRSLTGASERGAS